MNCKTLSIYKLYRIVDTVDTELAGEAYQRYLDKEANAAMIAALSESHLQNSHSAQAAGDPKCLIFQLCRSGGMADAPDSKSGRGNPVRVQVPPPAP